MDQKLPELLNYNKVKPVGYPSQIKYTKFTPQSFASSGTNEIIRFNIDANGFWDPYSAYIEIEIDCEDMDEIGTLQIDNSAHSFINELIISNQGVEIERVQEYDVLASILNDMAYSVEQRASKRHEGLGFLNIPNIRNDVFSHSYFSQLLGGMDEQNDADTHLAYYKQINQGFKPWLLQYTSNNAKFNSEFIYSYNDTIDVTKNPDNTTAPTTTDWYKTFHGALIQSIKRYDINHAILQNINTVEQDYVLNWVDYNETNDLPTNMDDKFISDHINKTSIKKTGFKQPFSTSLSGTCFEPFFSKNYSQSQTFKGKLNQTTKITKQTFQIPILSGILGVLMPKESYKYVPMTLLQNLMIEFRLNPYAMFTSGYIDDPKISSFKDEDFDSGTLTTQTYNTKMNTYRQQKRKWRVTSFDINVELHYFQPAVEQLIIENINSDNGIVLHTQSYMLGPIYNIDKDQSVIGTYQINLGFESMKNVLVTFIPNDFMTYTFCRKQFRCSANITELQFKIGQEFYPSEKIRGHGGIPRGVGIDSTLYGNNSQFIIELYKAFGKFHDTLSDCMINTANFCINDRCYNPANKDQLYTVTGGNVTNNKLVLNNIDTAAGMPLFHENRCVGKAVYGLNFETLNADHSVISGVNTMNTKPFEVIFRSDSNAFTNLGGTENVKPQFSRPMSMYIFCLYDMLIQIKKTGIQILGRG